MSSELAEASSGVRTPGEETPAVKPSVRMSRHCWAVVLASGDGYPFAKFDHQDRGRRQTKAVLFHFG